MTVNRTDSNSHLWLIPVFRVTVLIESQTLSPLFRMQNNAHGLHESSSSFFFHSVGFAFLDVC